MPPFAPLDPPVNDGALYFSVEELRAEQDVPDSYDDPTIERNRALAVEVIENGAGVAFLPRRRIERVRPVSNGVVRLSRPYVRELEALDIDGDAWTPQEIADRLTVDGPYVVGLAAYGRRLTATYTYGYDRPPERIRRAAMIATRIWAMRGPIDDRATQVAADGATINLATPGVLGSITGIPEVDAAIRDYAYRGHVFT